jgi:hypothetical protein
MAKVVALAKVIYQSIYRSDVQRNTRAGLQLCTLNTEVQTADCPAASPN